MWDTENGIGLHGNHLIQNYKYKSEFPKCINVLFKEDKPFSIDYPIKNKINSIYYKSVEYKVSINWNNNQFKIIDEFIKFDFEIYEGEYLKSKFITENSIILENHFGDVSSKFLKEDEYCNLEFFTPKSLINIVNNNFKQQPDLILNSPLSSIPINWGNYFKEMSFHDFDPKFCKMAYGNGNVNLTEYGDNLSLVIENILIDEDDKRKFINLVSSLLPYVKSVDVDNIKNEYRIFKLYEKYDETPVFAPFTLDGSANILALISALYFSNSDIIVIEEPERNIHPSLFIKLVNMMKEITNRDKQIIMTTHSPEILDYCDLEDIQLISRNQKGFSNISQPKNNKDVVEFVEELSIGHIFLNNYLGLGNE